VELAFFHIGQLIYLLPQAGRAFTFFLQQKKVTCLQQAGQKMPPLFCLFNA
jgi:hypothetical protein